MEDLFAGRERPVLEFIVRYLDENLDGGNLQAKHIVDGTGLSEADVHRALKALHEAGFIEGVTVAQLPYPVRITSVSERARREVGQWPGPEAFVDRLVEALTAAADDEPDEERQGRLRCAASTIAGVARDVAVRVATEAITGHL